MIYTVTLNPSLDHHIYLERLVTGEVNRICREQFLPGGKGINVSIMLNRLGVKSRILGFLAGSAGDELERLLFKQNLRPEFIRLKEGSTRVNVKLHAKEDTDLNGAGPDIRDEDRECLMERLNDVARNDYLVLSGKIPPALPEHFYADILAKCQGRNIRTVVDASGGALLSTLKYEPFLVKPNISELAEISGVDIHEIAQTSCRQFAGDYGRKLKEMGAKNVLVSLGADGAVLLTENGRILEQAAPVGRQVNSVGAGDSMVAGFLYGILCGSEAQGILRYAVAAGSASAFSEDFAGKEDVERFVKEMEESGGN